MPRQSSLPSALCGTCAASEKDARNASMHAKSVRPFRSGGSDLEVRGVSNQEWDCRDR